MKQATMKNALRSSLGAECDSFKKRIERADAAMGAAPRQSDESRVVRDSFSFPQGDYDRIAATRERALKRGKAATKAEVLRAGLIALSDMSDSELAVMLDRVEKIKTGRPVTV